MTTSCDHTEVRLADSVKDAAHRLGISRSSLWREIQEGKIVALKIRARTLISREEQQRWLADLPIANQRAADAAAADAIKANIIPDAPPRPSSGERKLVSCGSNVCGIYFLYSGADCVYVGKSTNILARVADHTKEGKTFDSFSYKEFAEADLDRMERHYIAEAKPILNRCGLSKRVRGSTANIIPVLKKRFAHIRELSNEV